MQTDLFVPTSTPPAVSTDADHLRNHLSYYKRWRSRKEICESLGWTERHLRDILEELGADVVRCQAGFKLTADITRDDVPLVIQSIDAFISQGKRMIRYALALRRKLHSLIG